MHPFHASWFGLAGWLSKSGRPIPSGIPDSKKKGEGEGGMKRAVGPRFSLEDAIYCILYKGRHTRCGEKKKVRLYLQYIRAGGRQAPVFAIRPPLCMPLRFLEAS